MTSTIETEDVVARLRAYGEAIVASCADGDTCLEAAGTIERLREENASFRNLLIETQDTIREAANDGEPHFGDLWRNIDAALTPSADDDK